MTKAKTDNWVKLLCLLITLMLAIQGYMFHLASKADDRAYNAMLRVVVLEVKVGMVTEEPIKNLDDLSDFIERLKKTNGR